MLETKVWVLDVLFVPVILFLGPSADRSRTYMFVCIDMDVGISINISTRSHVSMSR